jgi:DNA polymerase-3 subunit gamma/tau
MLSALDQVVAAGGLPGGGELLNELVDAIADRDTGRVLLAVDRAVQAGRAPRAFGEELIGRLRDVFLASMHADLARLPEDERGRVADQAKKLGARGATRALETLGEAFVGIQDAPDPRITLEIALVRITRPEADVSPAALLDRIERLEQGAPPLAPPSTADAPSTTSTQTSRTTSDTEPEQSPMPPPAAKSASGSSPKAKPADLARATLGQTRQQRASAAPRSTPKPSRSPKAAATRSATATTSAPPQGEAPPTPASATPSTPVTSSTTSGLPTRDDLTLAWGDTILPNLPNRAKARFGAGRWLAVDDAAVYALPNAHHRDRCEGCRPDVEAALAAHFGQPVPIRLVLDDEPGPAAAPDSPSIPDEDDIDVRELTDAPAAGASSVDRITDMFPGTELVEE